MRLAEFIAASVSSNMRILFSSSSTEPRWRQIEGRELFIGIGIGFWLDGETWLTLAKIAQKRGRLVGCLLEGGLEVEEGKVRGWVDI